jgi:medium-chain acyl-[acyl-carrier-protein] hydrolase
MNPEPRPSPVWTEQVKFCSYDVDHTARATSVSLCRHFLEAAWNHAEALGVGFNHLAGQGKFWVLSRLLLEVAAYPAWGSTASLRTWPRSARSVFALRDFEFTDAAGKRLAAGSSAWLVLDATTRRPQRLGPLLPGLIDLAGEAAVGRDPEKLADGECGETAHSLTVRYSDIDVNSHVNSTRYLAWMLDTYAAGFHRKKSLRWLEVNYLGETREGAGVQSHIQETGPDAFTHTLRHASGAAVCRARFVWSDTTAAAEPAPIQCAVGPAGGQLGFTPK